MSANEYLIDASTRHQIMLQRLFGGGGHIHAAGNFKSSFVGWDIVNNPEDYLPADISSFNNDRPVRFKVHVCMNCNTPFVPLRNNLGPGRA